MSYSSAWPTFRCRVPGKWVLAGEHAVLRGAAAVALPHPGFFLTLTFQPEPGGSWDGLTVMPSDAESVISGVLRSVEEEWNANDLSFPRPVGSIHVDSTIPIGAGLGSSAALCVALTRWMAEPLRLAPGKLRDFATQIEHRFHGESSGMDIAVVMAGEPISFVRDQGAKPLGVKRIPLFTFLDTGMRSRTSDCVDHVQQFREQKPNYAMKVDASMGAASRVAIEGLIRYDRGGAEDRSIGLKLIASAMEQANDCFLEWGLVPSEVEKQQELLKKQGALATKLTGAGAGGMVVALWGDEN